MNKNKAIGIIGGMGPEASAYMYKRMIELSIQEFGAKHNDDFPEIVIYSIPVPDFISDSANRVKALEMLQERVKKLNNLNLSCLAIACNTAHILYDDLQSYSVIPLISMVEEVSQQVSAANLSTVGFLGTPSTIKSGLYQRSLEKYHIKTIVPNDEQIVVLERIIRSVIAGNSTQKDNNELKKIADSLKQRGAQGIILGCTELPLVFPTTYGLPVYNSVEILSLALLRIYYKSNTI